MNRSELRRAKRNKSKKVFMTEEEISKMKSDAVDEAFNKVFGCLFTLPLIALKEEYGFGKKRLQVINDKMTDMLKEIEEDELDLNSLVKQMEEKYGIAFRYEEEVINNE